MESMLNQCQIDPVEGRARRIRGWGRGSLCRINPSQFYVFFVYRFLLPTFLDICREGGPFDSERGSLTLLLVAKSPQSWCSMVPGCSAFPLSKSLHVTFQVFQGTLCVRLQASLQITSYRARISGNATCGWTSAGVFWHFPAE